MHVELRPSSPWRFRSSTTAMLVNKVSCITQSLVFCLLKAKFLCCDFSLLAFSVFQTICLWTFIKFLYFKYKRRKNGYRKCQFYVTINNTEMAQAKSMKRGTMSSLFTSRLLWYRIDSFCWRLAATVHAAYGVCIDVYECIDVNWVLAISDDLSTDQSTGIG